LKAAKIAFHKQFGGDIKDWELPIKWYAERSPILQESIRLLKAGKNTARIQYKDYSDPVALLFNGAVMTVTGRGSEPYRFYPDIFPSTDGGYDYMFLSIEIATDYKPGTVNICGIKLCETLFDYLEKIKWLHSIKVNIEDMYSWSNH